MYLQRLPTTRYGSKNSIPRFRPDPVNSLVQTKFDLLKQNDAESGRLFFTRVESVHSTLSNGDADDAAAVATALPAVTFWRHFQTSSLLSPLLPSVCLSLRRSLSRVELEGRVGARRPVTPPSPSAFALPLTAAAAGGTNVDQVRPTDRPDDRRSLSLNACMTAVLSSRLSFYRRPPKGVHAPR